MSTALTAAERLELPHLMCAAADAGRAEDFGAWFADDATYTFGNSPTIVGREAVVAATAGAVGSLPWLEHVVEEVTDAGDRLFCRYTIKSGSRTGEALALPCMTVITLGDEGKIVDYRVFMDLSPALP
ncbi:nuclear transport factor 2 family protein [Pseudonocardia kujensis]|uniref:nuclear transport factor 2 family protein n=1 Tax=Pseudonocardia kujensis TaxID=1128675 RepID=UPI001E5BD57B|nr:nuclear transport factor 2 family protein [Pseudonocardia kujensis]MCE0764594.1 nuclear transport factor 2 family protein [Pseudonocardia kujensis]